MKSFIMFRHTLFTLFTVFTLFTILPQSTNAQGCSDAGFCTVGHINEELQPGKESMRRHELDIVYIYGTHGKYERFHQPQLNYRFVEKSGAYFEVRLPLNIAKNISTGMSTTGIGDAIVTYNNRFAVGKRKIDYSLGFRISFTEANKIDSKTQVSYPMYLQSGLGTTDLIAVAGYHIGKYISVGTGVQVPFIQYNNHIFGVVDNTGIYSRKKFRRQADALLKLTGHYSTGKLKLGAGVLSIFHLANDYYKAINAGNYFLHDSRGITINWNAEASYAITKSIGLSFLYAQPIVTRKNIPDGLARSKIFAPSVTFSF